MECHTPLCHHLVCVHFLHTWPCSWLFLALLSPFQSGLCQKLLETLILPHPFLPLVKKITLAKVTNKSYLSYKHALTYLML
jgi:hypothetical protein